MDILEGIIYPVIDEFNPTLPADRQLAKDPDTELFGTDNGLESIQLVSFVVAVEDHILDTMGNDLVLADEKAMSRRNSPFRNLAALAEYIAELLGEANEQ